MKRFGALLSVLTLLALLPAHASAQGHGPCPSSGSKVVEAKPVSVAESPKVSNPYVSTDVDVGSDGRVRDIRVIESSGDKVTDALVRDAIKTWTFAPAQSECVAASGVVRTGIRLRADAPVDHNITPPPESDACVPMVDAYISPSGRDFSKRGTADVAVPIDAAGDLAGTPTLTKSTGSATLDAEALRIARTASYGFSRGTGCRPQAIVYDLELTFK
jgi:TonB family protein